MLQRCRSGRSDCRYPLDPSYVRGCAEAYCCEAPGGAGVQGACGRNTKVNTAVTAAKWADGKQGGQHEESNAQ